MGSVRLPEWKGRGSTAPPTEASWRLRTSWWVGCRSCCSAPTTSSPSSRGGRGGCRGRRTTRLVRHHHQRDGQPVTVTTSDERATLVDQAQFEPAPGPASKHWRRAGGRGHRPAARRPVAGLRREVGCARRPLLAEHPACRRRPGSSARSTSTGTTALGSSVRTSGTASRSSRPRRRRPSARGAAQRPAARGPADGEGAGVPIGDRPGDRCTHGPGAVHDRPGLRPVRKHSQNTNRKLREVAVDVITRMTGHPPVTPAPFQKRDGNGGP